MPIHFGEPMRYAIYLSILLFISCQPMPPQPPPPINKADSAMVKKIFDEVLMNGQAYDQLRDLCYNIGPRLSGSENMAKAVEWSKKLMEDLEFDHVFTQEVMTPHWVRGKKETAKVRSKIAGNFALTILANGNSVATPKGGLTAEVIQMDSPADLEKIGKEKIAGKIVYFSRPFNQTFINTGRMYGDAGAGRFGGAAAAEPFGALGVVIRTLSSSHNEDDVPHTGNGAPSKIPTASMGVKSALALESALKKDPKLKISMTINSSHLEDAPSHNVIGELKGSEFPNEYIVVGGHLDSWDVGHGAHDDGTGCVQSIEVLRALKAIGYKPRYTIRAVMFANEENGLRGGNKYAELAKKNNEKHLVAMESDGGGFTPRGFGMSAGADTLAKVRSWLPLFNKRTITFINNGGGGADIGPLAREFNTPTIGLNVDNQRYFDLHHTEEDTFDKVNKRELHLGAASMAAMIYLMDKNGL
jgi:hypothetical protein